MSSRVRSEDAESHLRGQLVALKDEIERAIRKAGDKRTELHLRAAMHRIDVILDAKPPTGAERRTIKCRQPRGSGDPCYVLVATL